MCSPLTNAERGSKTGAREWMDQSQTPSHSRVSGAPLAGQGVCSSSKVTVARRGGSRAPKGLGWLAPGPPFDDEPLALLASAGSGGACHAGSGQDPIGHSALEGSARYDVGVEA